RGPACSGILMPPGSSRSRRQAVSENSFLNPATSGRASRRLPATTAIAVGTGRLSRSLAQARGQAGLASLAAWERSGRRRPGEMDFDSWGSREPDRLKWLRVPAQDRLRCRARSQRPEPSLLHLLPEPVSTTSPHALDRMIHACKNFSHDLVLGSGSAPLTGEDII